MGVDHELGQGAVNAGDGPFEQHKTRAGDFGGGFEIHRGGNAGDFEMFFWCEIKARQLAPAVDLDIVVLIGTLRDVLGGAVGNAGQHIGQLGIQLLGFGLHGCNLGLFHRHLGAQTFEFRIITLGLGGADGFGSFVLLGLGGLGGLDLGAAFFVQGKDLS